MDFGIRENRGKPSGKRLVQERAAYFQLMEQGYSTREAARIVGINLRTGKRWRNGWHSPPGGKGPVPPVQHREGLEALDRLAEGEPLWRIHEAVFAVLALESEPVDPRL